MEHFKDLLTTLSLLKDEKVKVSQHISNINDIIGKEADKLLEDIPDLGSGYYFEKIEDDLILYEKQVYEGRDWNNQDIYDIKELYLPVELLYDVKFKDEYIKELEDKKLRKQQEEDQRKLERIKEKEIEEREKYLELKTKFEGE